MDWRKYGQVISSQYRQKVILNLLNGPKNPKQIAVKTGLYLSHVSKTLKELATVDLVCCLTPGLKRGRIYKLTSEGEEIARYFKTNAEKQEGHTCN